MGNTGGSLQRPSVSVSMQVVGLSRCVCDDTRVTSCLTESCSLWRDGLLVNRPIRSHFRAQAPPTLVTGTANSTHLIFNEASDQRHQCDADGRHPAQSASSDWLWGPVMSSASRRHPLSSSSPERQSHQLTALLHISPPTGAEHTHTHTPNV